jgi:sterol desaturase/sphingolipid hydroxylase (fatty acid hydroxylase superfamily)
MLEQVPGFLVDNRVLLTFLAVIVSLILFPLLEGFIPTRSLPRQVLRRRWPTNLGLLVINQFNVSLIAATATVFVAWWTAERELGLLTHLELGFWTATLITLLAFEFISYTYHRLLHSVPVLWRMHAVHHCDTDIDFTTTFRNHPLELLTIVPFSVPFVILLGPPAASVVLYQIIRSLVLVFAHSNLRIPVSVDRCLRWFITTPDYHRLHHSNDRQYTDSNFCPTFPIYDYLFGTAKHVPQAQLPEMDLGLDYLSTPRQTRLLNLLLLPFVWNRPGARGSEPATLRPPTENRVASH